MLLSKCYKLGPTGGRNFMQEALNSSLLSQGAIGYVEPENQPSHNTRTITVNYTDGQIPHNYDSSCDGEPNTGKTLTITTYDIPVFFRDGVSTGPYESYSAEYPLVIPANGQNGFGFLPPAVMKISCHLQKVVSSEGYRDPEEGYFFRFFASNQEVEIIGFPQNFPQNWVYYIHNWNCRAIDGFNFIFNGSSRPSLDCECMCEYDKVPEITCESGLEAELLFDGATRIQENNRDGFPHDPSMLVCSECEQTKRIQGNVTFDGALEAYTDNPVHIEIELNDGNKGWMMYSVPVEGDSGIWPPKMIRKRVPIITGLYKRKGSPDGDYITTTEVVNDGRQGFYGRRTAKPMTSLALDKLCGKDGILIHRTQGGTYGCFGVYPSFWNIWDQDFKKIFEMSEPGGNSSQVLLTVSTCPGNVRTADKTYKGNDVYECFIRYNADGSITYGKKVRR